MRALVGILAAGAVLASAAWTAAVPAPPVAEGSLSASTVPAGGFPKTIVDPLGARATLSAPPRRIVSIELSGDELLLGLVGPDRLVGVTPYVDDPSTTLSQPLAPRQAARVTEEDPEALLALRPDLVVTAGYTRAEAIVVLEAAHVPVLGTGAHATLDDVLAAIVVLGDAVGEPERARTWVSALHVRLNAIDARPRPARPPRVLLWEGGYTYAAGTLPDDLVRRAGGVNVATDAGLKGPVAISEEGAVALSPEVVIVPIDEAAPRWHDVALVGDAPVWGAVEAVRTRRVYGVPRAWIGSVSHHAVRALEAVADIVREPAP
jgi:iron complex transport system substrate-binding protein